MADEVQENFVRCFINYLKRQVDSQALTPDAQESCEVAIQCLQAAFDLGEEMNSTINEEIAEGSNANASGSNAATDETNKPWDPKNINLFELFEEVYLNNNPNNAKLAESIKNEGNRLMKEGKYNEALLQYNRAITYDPRNPIFYCNRAAAYIRLGENERAVTDCKTALVYNVNYGKAYGRLGIAFSNLGKYDEAQQAYTRAIELEPDNQDYRNNLEVARNSRNQSNNFIPQLTGSLNAMLSNPTIRQLFSSTEIDLDQLQNMSQNPMVMNAIGQIFTNLQGGAAGGAATGGPGIGIGISGLGGGGSGGATPMPNDMLQLFQTFAQQLATAATGQQQPQQQQQQQQETQQQQQQQSNIENNENATDNSDQQQQPPPPPPPSATS